MIRKVPIFLLAMFFYHSAMADTFIVTSNADSGPGTLREAIKLANMNGTSVADNIIFNIPDITEAGRTINLQSELPFLSSRITIDGSTQPGSVLGISTAKITLYLDHFTSLPFNFIFIQNASDVNIYGLCFKFFDNPDVGGGGNYAVVLRNSFHVTVGAPGKGNLFSAVRSGITNNYWNYYSDSVRYVTIQSNVFGLNSLNFPVLRGSIDLIRAADIVIGGASLAEGNVFVGAGVRVSQTGISNSNFFVKIQNNKFNLNWDGSRYYNEGGSIMLWGNTTDDTSTTKTYILDNILSGGWPGGIGLTQLFHTAIIKGNKISTDITGTVCKGSNNDVGIQLCKKVIIGGNTPSEENIIPATIYTQTRGVHIIKNQFGSISVINPQPGDPFIKIVSYDLGLITGKSDVNAKIQLYSNECILGCIKRKYLTTTYSNASGDWSFPYTPSMPNIVATATTEDSSTSAFSEPKVNHLNVARKNPTCGRSNGSITGIVIKEGTHIKWMNSSTGQIVSRDTNLVNVPEGSYVLTVSNGDNGCPWSANFALYDVMPPSTISTNITHASCGQNNGIIYTPSSASLSFKWLNVNNDSVGTNYFANKLPPGTYYLKAWVTYDTSCNKIYGPFIVQNQVGPSLNTNNIQINQSICGTNKGSITGVTPLNATGTPYVQWLDSLNKPVGNNYDLLNVLPGKYRLKFKDVSGCDTIVTSFYTIPDIGVILIDTAYKQVTSSKCSGASGSIQQLHVAGGDRYEWKNTANNTVVGNTPDVFNLSPGNYQLTVTNQYGCTKTSPVIAVPLSTFIPIEVTNFISGNALCGQNNGFIKINSFNNDFNLYTFRWVDSISGQNFNGASLQNLGGGSYQLFAKDYNGCEKMIFSKRISSYPVPTFDYSQVIIKNDECNLHQGSISSLRVNGLVGPTTYTWYDQNTNVVGNTLSLQKAGAGTYIMKVSDGGVCAIQSTPFILNNNNNLIAAPLYDNIVIPRYSNAALNVKNSAPGLYEIYIDAMGSSMIQKSNNGNFVVPKIHTDTIFYIKRISGSCSSPLVPINIKVVDKSYFAIPSAFTPNGDGKNDRLLVKVMGYIDLIYFRIYNRWGELVYETGRLNEGWDGTIKGNLQNGGAFVWVAQGKDINGKIVTDKGSFILIR